MKLMLFKLNYKYHLYVSYKKNNKSYFKSKLTNKLTKKPRNLIAIYKKNF